MAYDIHSIKDRVLMPELLRRDGIDLRRAGSTEFCRCPFHEEKSGSCKVEEKRFHCFGCGANGDIFDYWEKSRQVSKKDAIEALAILAGISPDLPGYTRPVAPPKPKQAPEEIIPPLTPEEIGEWFECVDRLRTWPGQIERIAKWRGYSIETVHWAIERGIIGLMKWSGIWREAFLVEMPVAPSGPLTPVTVHVRLGPHTRSNDKPKPSWRFAPKGRGAWPLIFGDLHTATYIFAVEGQWDALALVDLMRWHQGPWPESTAVVGMRGSTSFKKLLAHYALNEKATLFAIADADNAGQEWFLPGGFIHQLEGRVARIYSFWPGQAGLDLNDLLKRGLDRSDLLTLITPKLRSERHRGPVGITFLQWCQRRAKVSGDEHAPAASAVVADKSRPRGRCRITTWERHWKKLNLSDDRRAALRAAWDTYKQECTPP